MKREVTLHEAWTLLKRHKPNWRAEYEDWLEAAEELGLFDYAEFRDEIAAMQPPKKERPTGFDECLGGDFSVVEELNFSPEACLARLNAAANQLMARGLEEPLDPVEDTDYE